MATRTDNLKSKTAAEPGVKRDEAGAIIGTTENPQPQFGEPTPTATASKFLHGAEGKKGSNGPVDSRVFNGSDAEKQAQDFVAANQEDGSYWVVTTASRQQEIDPETGAPTADADQRKAAK